MLLSSEQNDGSTRDMYTCGIAYCSDFYGQKVWGPIKSVAAQSDENNGMSL